MIDYSTFSPDELKAIILHTAKLDSGIVEKYFVPKWPFYEEQGSQLLQQGEEERLNIEFSIGFFLLISESMARSQMKTVLNTSLGNKEVVEKLLPFHREVQGLLDYTSQEILTFSAPLVKVVLREKESYEQLLEELTQIIKEHSHNAGKVDIPSESPVNNAFEQVQEVVREKLKQEAREEKILVTIKPEALESVMVAFLPFIKSEQEQTLLQLFTTGTSSEPIYFNESRLILGDFFRRLKDDEMLIGAVFYTELAKWLSQHFYFKNKKKKGFTPVNEESILAVMQDGDKPKKGINFN